MGGQLGHASTAETGFTFWFTLRLEPATEGLGDVISPLEANGHNAATLSQPGRSTVVPACPAKPELNGKILLVEDNPANQKVATLMLRRLGLTVEVAADGAEAVAAFRRSSFDAILMDCQMPQMDGLEATRQIREIENHNRRTPIIALTANVLNGQRERCLQVGMDDYVSKPINPEALTEALISWLLRPKQDLPAACAGGAEVNGALFAEVQAFVKDMYSDMDPEDSMRFLEMVSTSVPSGLKDVITELAANNLMGVSQAAHRLRNSAGAVGARELSDALQRMEQAIADGDTRSAQSEMPIVKKGAEDLAAILTKLTSRKLVA